MTNGTHPEPSQTSNDQALGNELQPQPAFVEILLTQENPYQIKAPQEIYERLNNWAKKNPTTLQDNSPENDLAARALEAQEILAALPSDTDRVESICEITRNYNLLVMQSIHTRYSDTSKPNEEANKEIEDLGIDTLIPYIEYISRPDVEIPSHRLLTEAQKALGMEHPLTTFLKASYNRIDSILRNQRAAETTTPNQTSPATSQEAEAHDQIKGIAAYLTGFDFNQHMQNFTQQLQDHEMDSVQNWLKAQANTNQAAEEGQIDNLERQAQLVAAELDFKTNTQKNQRQWEQQAIILQAIEEEKQNYLRNPFLYALTYVKPIQAANLTVPTKPDSIINNRISYLASFDLQQQFQENIKKTTEAERKTDQQLQEEQNRIAQLYEQETINFQKYTDQIEELNKGHLATMTDIRQANNQNIKELFALEDSSRRMQRNLPLYRKTQELLAEANLTI